MPSLYAHNKFGKKVLKNLPQNLRDIVADYQDAFRIGLQGPDSIFYYYPVYKNSTNQYGVKIHHEDAYPFFEDALSIISAYGYESSCHAYILGYICHFVLDRECHPLVDKYMEDSGCGHIEIEGDLEHLMMSLDGFEPAHYASYRLIPANLGSAFAMAPFFSELSTSAIHTALVHMRLTKRLFFAPGPKKQIIIDSIMKASFHYKYFKGHMIEASPNDNCRPYSKLIYEKLLESIPLAVDLIEEFEHCLTNDLLLPDSFHGDFYGKKRI
ncbi:MAG: zinc dependent phospholipase C family protein [Lachnospiraceae bacterium]|nr:zinc dependent phospholipase C family protein [Lachnospiraceae bacterium]